MKIILYLIVDATLWGMSLFKFVQSMYFDFVNKPHVDPVIWCAVLLVFMHEIARDMKQWADA